MRWSPKDPDEISSYSVDWSRFLGEENISQVNWFVEDSSGVVTSLTAGNTINGLTLANQSNTPTVATAQFENGDLNKTYKVTCRITYGTNTAERTIQLPMREK